MTAPENLDPVTEQWLASRTREQEEALLALKAGRPNAEWRVLEAFARGFTGGVVLPLLQQVVNALLVKAVLQGHLPAQPKGRRKQIASDGLAIALAYFELVDAGRRSEDAAYELSERFGPSERHIMRIVSECKDLVGGDDPSTRANTRALWAKAREGLARAPRPRTASPLPDLNDPIKGLFGIDRRIAELLASLDGGDKK